MTRFLSKLKAAWYILSGRLSNGYILLSISTEKEKDITINKATTNINILYFNLDSRTVKIITDKLSK